MRFIKVKTKKFLPPRDDIFPALDKYLPKLKNGDVLLIASKILAIHQGRCVANLKIKNLSRAQSRDQKSKIISQEADYLLPKHKIAKTDITLTIKNHTLIPSAGIDESNGNGYYILWPKNTNRLCKQICKYLKKRHALRRLAVIATDSHTTPLRWGVSGISIGFWGLQPLFDYRGKKDIFSRKLKHTQSNVVDALSAMGVLLMGEGSERVPMVILRGAKFVKFTDKETYKKFVIDPKKDLYYPLLKIFKKKK